MNQYFLKKECKELHAFPHVIEFAFKKVSAIQFDSFKKEVSGFLRFYYVIDGRFDWMIDGQLHILYPGDLAIILPGQSFGGILRRLPLPCDRRRRGNDSEADSQQRRNPAR